MTVTDMSALDVHGIADDRPVDMGDYLDALAVVAGATVACPGVRRDETATTGRYETVVVSATTPEPGGTGPHRPAFVHR
ncbi:hypothetical protein [Nocardia brevicatena]|uniref:hypothetical protein n=1 Tax=Nocardia brevicatena TaxID=37327 RepID=UPI0002E4B050|nr:hypothetical protein [Nocardia brevicatena]